MGIKAIDYDDLKEGDLITWYGMHVLRWEDDIRPLGIEPTIAFVQDDTLESENQRLRELLVELCDLVMAHAEQMPTEVINLAIRAGQEGDE